MTPDLLGTTGAVAGDALEIVRTDRSQFVAVYVNGGAGGGALHASGGPGVTTFRFDGANWALEHATRANGVRVVNVKDFGARGDGVTGDRAAIQAGIVGVVYLPHGTYLIDGLPDGGNPPIGLVYRGQPGHAVRFVGDSGAGQSYGTKLLAASSLTGGTLLRFYGGNSVVMEDLFLE